MLIVRNSVCLTALVAALALGGCGSAGESGKGGCDPGTFKKGCVDILNFRSTTETFAGVSIPARHAASNGHTEPGIAAVKESDTSLNSLHPFFGAIGGQNVSVTCTVTGNTWVDVNPEVIIQQEAFGALVNCELW
jgi:hypothetical protein